MGGDCPVEAPGWEAPLCPQTHTAIYFALHIVLAGAFLLGSHLLWLLNKTERPVGSWSEEEMAVLPARSQRGSLNMFVLLLRKLYAEKSKTLLASYIHPSQIPSLPFLTPPSYHSKFPLLTAPTTQLGPSLGTQLGCPSPQHCTAHFSSLQHGCPELCFSARV